MGWSQAENQDLSLTCLLQLQFWESTITFLEDRPMYEAI